MGLHCKEKVASCHTTLWDPPSELQQEGELLLPQISVTWLTVTGGGGGGFLPGGGGGGFFGVGEGHAQVLLGLG